MSKAEKFITEHTMNGSNQIINGNYGTIIPHYNPWLTPDQAKKAVEIAREEVLDVIEKELTRRMLEDYNEGVEEDEIAQGCMASLIMFVRQLKEE